MSTVTPPSSDTTGVTLTVRIAGQTHVYPYTPSLGLAHAFTWDGLDASSASVFGSAEAELEIVESYTPAQAYVETTKSKIQLGFQYTERFGLGGWMLSVHHDYDPVRKTLYKGDGTFYSNPGKTMGSETLIPSLDQKEVYIFSSGRHTQTKSALTGVVLYAFSYDGSGKLVSVEDTYGNETTIQYTSGKISSITAPFGHVTSISTNANGYIETITNPKGESYEVTYYPGGLLHTFEKPTGFISTMTYDGVGRLVSDENTSGSSVSLARTYNANGWAIENTSDLGFLKTHTVTANDSNMYKRVTSNPYGLNETYEENYSSKYAYYLTNAGYSVQTITQNDSRYGDSLLVPASYFEAHGGVYGKSTSYSYSSTLGAPGDPFSVTAYSRSSTTSSKTTTTSYSSSTDRITTASPLNRTYKEDLDANERVIQSQYASLTPVTYAYDTHGRLEEIVQGVNRTTTLVYHSTSGFLASITNALNQTTAFEYDLAGRVSKQIFPDTREVEFEYDGEGQITKLTTPSGSEHEMTYNGHGFMASYVAPLARKLGLEKPWGVLRRLLRKTQASLGLKSLTTEYDYDNDRRLTSVERPNADTVTYGYSSANGLLSSITTPAGTNSYNFYLGRPSSSTSSDGVSTFSDYNGHLISYTQTTYASGETSTPRYTYENYKFNLDSDRVDTNLVSVGDIISYTYDDDGLLTGAGSETLTRNSATGFLTETALGSNMKQFFSYTSTYGELSQIQAKYGTTVKFQEDMIRDNLGRIDDVTIDYGSGSDHYEYTFDSAGRLTQVDKNSTTIESYSYDNNSNRTSQTINGVTTTATYDNQDRLETFGTKTFTYNDNGELTQVVDTATSQTTSYTYDAFGNLKSVTLPSSTVISYRHDAYNRRVERKSGSTVTARYVYGVRGELLATIDSTGNILQRYVYGSKSHVPDYMIVGSTTYQIVHNHLGSPVQVIDTATGTVAQEVKYDTWGNITSDTSPGFQPFGFAGCLYDNDTLLCHLNSRVVQTSIEAEDFSRNGRDYDPNSGKWLEKDPIRFESGDTNLYSYASTDPLNFIDSNGQVAKAIETGGGSSAAVRNAAVGVAIMCSIKKRPRIDCAKLQKEDSETCRKIQNPQENARCFKQVGARQTACNAGLPLPPLW